MRIALFKHSQQRGVALITALLIVALATTAAAWMTNQHQLSIRRSGNIINGDQAYEYALGLEMMAIIMLNEDFKDPDNKTDGFSDLWAVEVPPLPVYYGLVFDYVAGIRSLVGARIGSILDDGQGDAAEKLYSEFVAVHEADRPLRSEQVAHALSRLESLWSRHPGGCNAVAERDKHAAGNKQSRNPAQDRGHDGRPFHSGRV